MKDVQRREEEREREMEANKDLGFINSLTEKCTCGFIITQWSIS